MEELDLFKKRVGSYIEKAYTGSVALLNFLDEAQIGALEIESKKSGLTISYSGGILDSDRKRAIISMYDVNLDDFKINIVKINYNKRFHSVAHRSILGSLMGLGIKRECIGDIVIEDNGDAYFAITKEITDYVLSELKFVGSAPVELELYSGTVKNVIKYEDKKCFVSSLRLDVIVAQAYNLSRSEVLEMMSGGLVFLNHVLNQNPSHIVKLDDEISVRHKGRIKLSYIGGESKSGRLCVTISKRV